MPQSEKMPLPDETPDADVRIERDPSERGRKLVMVRGKPWGRADMGSAGANGAYYTFSQIGGAYVIERSRYSSYHTGNMVHTDVKVWGDKTAKRLAYRDRQPEPAPLADRLLAEAQALVRDGLLRDPEIVKAEREAAAAKRREADELRERRARGRLVARAWDILNAHLPYEIPSVTRNALAEAIADAIEAGRSQ